MKVTLHRSLWIVLLDEWPGCLCFVLIWLWRLLWLRGVAASVGLGGGGVVLNHDLEVLQTVFLKIRYQHS